MKNARVLAGSCFDVVFARGNVISQSTRPPKPRVQAATTAPQQTVRHTAGVLAGQILILSACDMLNS